MCIFASLIVINCYFCKQKLPCLPSMLTLEYETIFDLFFSEGELERIEARNKPGKKPLPQSKMVQARKFVEEYAYRISEKWYQFFVLKADIVLEKITKELK